MENDLKNFYENKYVIEKDKTNIETISYKKYPINRYEAGIKYFSDNFKGGSILELGAGNGIITNSILKANKNIDRYLASDLSSNRLNGIKKNIEDSRLEVKQIEVESFDFATIGQFDAIIMIALIEHFIDPLNTMRRVKEALKPGGFIYIDTPNIADYGARFKLLRGKFPSTGSKSEGLLTYDNQNVTLHDEGHLHYFTYRSLSRMLINYSGFSKTEKYYYPVGRLFFGKAIHYKLAKFYPELFSALALIAK
ncbi:MAG: class I SAM-dependent methyltransferase [Bacteroidota bacterium]|nr:class I SAM-dependent methyltransferase [Bacteroidota bacterium]